MLYSLWALKLFQAKTKVIVTLSCYGCHSEAIQEQWSLSRVGELQDTRVCFSSSAPFIAMACTCGGVAIVDGRNPIIDIQTIIEDWAWGTYIKRVGKFRKLFLRREDFEVDVPMNYYQFEETKTRFTDVSDDPTMPFKPKAAAETNESKTDVNPNMSILSTQYKNDTNMDQIYRFRLERSRKATVSVTYQRGFSVGGKAKFSLGVVDGEVNMKLDVTRTKGETFEQTLVFETNSDINVEKNSNCIAKVFFTERELRKKFTVKTKMSMPSRSAPVFIRRKKDKKLFALLQITDLAYVFDPYEERKEVKYIEEIFDDEAAPGGKALTHNVQITTTGIIEGIRLSGQTVSLQSVELDKTSEPKSLNEGITDHETYHNGVKNDHISENT